MALLAPGAAHAGAWQVADEGQTISAVALSESAQTPALDLDIMVEQPLTKDWSTVTQTRVEANGFGAATEIMGAMKRSWAVPSWNGAVALQAAGLWTDGPDLACTGAGAEARVLAGGAARNTPLFVNLEAAYRGHAGGCGHWRGDATIGYRPSERWLTLGQLFYDADVHASDTIKVQVSAVRFLRGRHGVQIGVRARIGAAAAEPALVLAWWRSARDH